jgi:hypothetical protein
MPDLGLHPEQGALDGFWDMLAVEWMDACTSAMLQNVAEGVLLPLLLLLLLLNRSLQGSVQRVGMRAR